MEIDKKLAYSIIVQSLGCLYENDRKLFDNNGRIYERALAFRFAHYLANIIENNKDFGLDLNVDNEYERHIEHSKTCFIGCNTCQRDKCFIQTHKLAILQARNLGSLDANIRPDIIVHERRTNKNNCLVIEIKTLDNDNSAKNPDIYDTAKLTYLTCPYPEDVHRYHYNIGFAICLLRDKSKIWSFVNGKNLGLFIVPFNV